MNTPLESANRVLFVDDDRDTCEMMNLMLQDAGYRVATAASVAEALALARAESFDIYILDNWLPDGLGLELSQQLRILHPTSPIVFCSGVEQETEIQKARAAGADAYLVKPCDFELIQTTLLGLLRKKDLQSPIN